MTSLRRQQKTQPVSYSRKTAPKTIAKPPAAPQIHPPKPRTDEASTGFWDFDDSSDDERRAGSAIAPAKAREEIHAVTKRRAAESVEERARKTVVTVQSMVQFESRQEGTRRENLDVGKDVTPRKSSFTGRTNNVASSHHMSRQKTPQRQVASPRPSTPTARPTVSQPTTPPRPSPKQSTTPTSRPFARAASSPLSTPPSSHNSISQPLPRTPRPKIRSSPRSRTFSGAIASPKMTPKQAQIWDSLRVHEDPSPSRRRLVDRLREEASRTPDRSKTPSPRVPQSQSAPTFSIDDEISRILEYSPAVVDDKSSARKESQSESQGTYASRSRSFLADSSNDALSMEELWQIDFEEERAKDVVEEEDLGVRSWHELKRGGQDKRLLDEMEDLIEECKSGGRLGLRRSSVLQIVDKLFGDVEWRRKFKGLGLMSMFIQTVADAHTDPILLTLTLLAVDLVPKPVPPTMSAEMLKLCLVGLKEVRALGALSSLRSMNVSKVLKSELLSLETKITNSGPGILNAQHLAFNILVDLRVSDIRPICAFLNDVEEEFHWAMLVSLAGALEKSTQGRVIPGLTTQDIQPFNPILQAGLKDFESNFVTRKATLSLLRVCINLTNSTGEICEYLAPDLDLPELLAGIITSDPQRYSDTDYRRNSKSHSDHLSATHEADHEHRESRFEVLLLSLGLMINFVQESDATKDLVLTSRIPTSILHIFEKLLSRDEPANHAFGYLALLLAHLMLPSHSGKAVSTSKGTRNWVLKLLDDFVGIHRVVQSQSQEEAERNDIEGMAGEVERVLVQLRAQPFPA